MSTRYFSKYAVGQLIILAAEIDPTTGEMSDNGKSMVRNSSKMRSAIMDAKEAVEEEPTNLVIRSEY